MSIHGEQVLLRAYLQSADRAPHSPTYERIVQAARKAGLSGATVLRGILGFGSHGTTKASVWSLVQHVPIIVEIVDSAQQIVDFMECPLEHALLHGMITLERAHVMLCRQRGHDEPNSLTLGTAVTPLSTLPRIQASSRMNINENGVLLRVFVGDSDKFEKQPLYEAIVQKTRELGLAGATVLRGTEGFGANSVVHTASILDLSADLPVVVEIVDTEEKIKLLLPHLETMVQQGMITMEHVAIILYRHNAAAQRSVD